MCENVHRRFINFSPLNHQNVFVQNNLECADALLGLYIIALIY